MDGKVVIIDGWDKVVLDLTLQEGQVFFVHLFGENYVGLQLFKMDRVRQDSIDIGTQSTPTFDVFYQLV